MNQQIDEAVVFIRSMRFWGTQLVSYPVLYQIKHWWPDCKITVVGKDPLHQHYEPLPWVSRFVNANTLGELIKTVTPDIDLMLSLHAESETYGIISFLKRPKFRLGFKNGRITDFTWNRTYPKDRKEYIALANMHLLNSLKPFDPESAARGCLQDLAEPESEHLPSDLILMLPGGGDGAYKRWPIQSFHELYLRLKTNGFQSQTFGYVLGPDEQEEAAFLKQLLLPDVLLFENCTIGELSRLMLGAKLIVANDCGPSHLAQFSCVPYVCVLHEPNPEWFWQRPYSRFVIPRNGSTEISHVRVEDVAKACIELIHSKRPFDL